MSTEQEKVLARVRKMMRLANDAGASQGERDNAIRMAHATLAKHNLSMSEAEAAGAKSEEARVENGEMYGENHPWTRTAAAAIADLFFCAYFYVPLRNSKVRHYFVGKMSNVITAKELSQFVIAAIDKEGRKYAKETYTGGGGWRSFCKGAALQVYARCKKIREEAERPAAQPTGTALVLASVYAQEAAANKALIEQAHGELEETADRQTRPDFSAREAGRAYGETISLNNQITSNNEDVQQIAAKPVVK